ncbi:polymorphic outer membrane protein middle domain-containing protein [Candidatus Chlamydia corallus]|uniref:polymorphic outer membrane protein middle domain-containing protein n=1 Tax=Candidatus Chlamydia corallus TaxID=2038470 RepID=UPI000C2FD1C4|nr:polymorphic outer membrane protein middle domain-containing protein [Candidatus Chlamydia corallus]
MVLKNIKNKKSLESKTTHTFLSYLGTFTTFTLGITSSVYSLQTDYFAKYALEKKEEYRKSFPLIDSLSNLMGVSSITTFVGNRHNSSEDIVLFNYKSIDNILFISTSSGGALSCKDFTLSNVKDHAFFSKNLALGNGGAITCEGGCTITNNKGVLVFLCNTAIKNNRIEEESKPKGGAIACRKDCTISYNQGTLYLINNYSTYWGGAIYTLRQCNIQNNASPILFFNNTAINHTLNSGGGAIDSEHTTISNNTRPIYFKNNHSSNGGAVKANSTFTIKNNYGSIIFNNNSGSSPALDYGSGGAVYGTIMSIDNNPGIIVFNNNRCDRDGGAICIKSLTIKNSGPVYFTNNQGTWGGAIMLRKNSTCLLFAEQGDIVFQNNKIFQTTFGRYNAIHCTPNSNLQLGASKGRKTVFFDPIEHQYLTTNPLIFNPNPNHQGMVLFSSAYIPEDFNYLSNFISCSKNSAELRNGVLSIEDRAGWEFYKFTQKGGVLKLGHAASIATSSNADTPSTSVGSEIIINNLAINLPLVLEKGTAPNLWIRPTQSAAPFTEDNNARITLSGPLTLLNKENRDPYDSLNLSEPLQNIRLLSLSDVNARHINTDNFYPESLNATEHYGYQGIWSPYWIETVTATNSASIDTANTLYRTLYANWTPTGYKANPEYQGDLAATPLWQSFHTIFSLLRSYDMTDDHYIERGFLTTQGTAEGLFVHQNSTTQASGFRIDSTGYSLQASTQTVLHRKISLGFSQFFSNTKEIGSKNTVSAHTIVSSLYLELPWLKETFATSAALAYSYGNHHLHSLHPSHQERAEGRCYSHALAAALGCSLPWQQRSHLLLSPFIQAIAIRSNQTAFEEIGDNPRKFISRKPLYNLTLPLGIQGKWHTKFHLSTEWALEVSYQPVLYQQNPEVGVTLLASGGSWDILGLNYARNALGYKLRNQTILFPHVVFSLDYQGSVSPSTSTHHLQARTILGF